MNQPANSSAPSSQGRRVILGMNATLDGYVGGPDGELDWMWPTMDPALGDSVTQFLQSVDTILIGRDTYVEQAAHWSTQAGAMADLLNAHTKVVFSSTLKKLDWNNSRLAAPDAGDEIAQLKQRPGKNIFLTGGATLAQSLTRLGLIDEYHIVVHPVVLGAGKRLFADVPDAARLELVGNTTYATGAVQLDYQRI